MKKIMLLLACILLVACIKKPNYQSTTAYVTYSFDAGKDMGGLFNFTATYVGKDNKPVKERIGSLPWKKQVVARTPFNAHLDVDFSVKSKFPDQETYEVGFNGLIEQTAKSKSVTSNGLTKTAAEDGKLRFSVTLPEGVSPQGVNLAVAPLKYDKHFAFTFTVDDTYENAWSRIFPLVHKKWIDKTEFFHLGNTPTTGYTPEHTLAVSDGCGNERRFGYGVAITPTYRNSSNKYEPRMQESSRNSMYVTWEELRILLDFGCFVHFHNVDETKYAKTDPSQIAQGLLDDYNKVIEKLDRKMKVLALPDGNKSYLEAAASVPQIVFTRNALAHQKLIYLNDCAGLRGRKPTAAQTPRTSQVS